MSADLEIFPECPGYGFTVQPQYMVNIVRREGGFERTDSRWERCLNYYTSVPLGPRDEEEIQSILYFWHAMGGRATTFLIKDWADYKSCQTQSEPTALDQPLIPVSLEGGGTGYRLIKRYTVGSFTQDREITKPDGATILVANESATADSSWVLDDDTGLLTAGGSFPGTPTTWGGEFFVPVRFNSELEVQITDKQIQSVQFTLIEKRIPLSNVFSGDVGGGGAGIVFTDSTEIDTGQYQALASSGGVLITRDNLGNVSRSTDDGDTWTTVLDSTAESVVVSCLSHGNGKFMMGGSSSGNSAIYESSDGTSWAPVSSVANIGAVTGIVYGASSHWVAVSAEFSGGPNCLKSSDNGATWTSVTAGAVGQFGGNPMYYVGSTFVGLDNVGSLATSTDNGTTWSVDLFTQADWNGATANPPCLTFDGSTLMVGGSTGGTFDPAVIFDSTPAGLLTATVRSLVGIMPTSDSVAAIVKGGSTYVAFGNASGVHELASSGDGITWVQGNNGTGDPVDGLIGGQTYLTFDLTNNKIVAMLNGHMIRATPP